MLSGDFKVMRGLRKANVRPPQGAAGEALWTCAVTSIDAKYSSVVMLELLSAGVRPPQGAAGKASWTHAMTSIDAKYSSDVIEELLLTATS